MNKLWLYDRMWVILAFNGGRAVLKSVDNACTIDIDLESLFPDLQYVLND